MRVILTFALLALAVALGNKCEVNPDCCSKECQFYSSSSSYKCCLPDVVTASNIKNIVYTQPPWSNTTQCKSDLECCAEHCVTIGSVKGCLPCIPVPLTKCAQDDDCCPGARCNTTTTKCCLPDGIQCLKQVNTSQPVSAGELCCSGVCMSGTCTSCVGVGSNGCVADADCCFKSSCVSGRCCVKKGGACITGIQNSDCCSKSCTAGICD